MKMKSVRSIQASADGEQAVSNLAEKSQIGRVRSVE
jgi:hypothetical protein